MLQGQENWIASLQLSLVKPVQVIKVRSFEN